MTLPCPFGKYTLLERLATGGMAEIFLARSAGLEGFHKRLVIKRILPALANNPDFVQMFIKEAGISMGLSHPNVVQIFDSGRVHGDPYIAMEYIHGRDLAHISRQLRQQDARLPVPLAIYVTAGLLRGLAYAHRLTDPAGRSLHLVHRDVSPHNVLVSFQGEVKLLDFGIARLSTAEVPVPGRVGGGKFAYMSPEQASGQPLDPRSDLFSVGVVLYELLAGRRLFQHPNPREKLRQVREAIVPDLREEDPHLPPALWSILQRLLARTPEDRYANAEQVEEDLWAFLFSAGLRADAAALARFMAGLFPESVSAAATLAHVDLAGLADDLGRIDADTSTQSSAQTLPPARHDHTTEGQTASGRTASTSTASGGGSASLPLKPGEQRTVSILVAELCGLTALSALHDPSVVVRRHYALLRRIRRVVDRHGGLLESFRDDILVIFFGLERAQEGDLERAIACAASLLRELLRPAPATEAGTDVVPVGLSVGVHIGELAVGGRSGRSVRYLARGDTMKLARRLCAEAAVGEVRVSDRVARLTEGAYHFAAADALRLKGQPEGQPTWRLVSRRRQQDAAAAAGRWLRRGEEPEILAEALRMLGEGQGGLLQVEGEGGTGKTRLLHEVARLARSRSVPFFSAAALPYGGSGPLAPLRDLVAAILGLGSDSQTPEAVRERLGRLSQLRLDEVDQSLIGGLFGLRAARPVTPSDMQRAAAVLVQRLAEDQPLILALDDAQNLAAPGVALIGHVLAEAASLPVLFLMTTRGALPPALGTPRWSIRLSPLVDEVLRKMAAEHLGARSLQAELAWLLSGTTRGNPMHLTMVINALQQHRQITLTPEGMARLSVPAEEIKLPPGVDGLITARVDALSESARRFLQVAAVVGVRFSPSLVAAALGLAGSGVAAECMRLLEQQGLIVAGPPEGEGQARFVTPLVWEVVRRSMVANRLRQHHALVADAMEALWGDAPGPQRAVLAMHCAAAGRTLDAARHALHAGTRLERQGLLREAADQWDQGIRWLEQAQRESGTLAAEAQPLAARLWLRRGEVAALLSENSGAERWLTLAQELASETLDAEIEARASLALGRLYRAQGQSTVARAHLDAALAATYAHGVATGPEAQAQAAWRRQVAVEALEALGMLEQDRGQTHTASLRFQLALSIAGDDAALAARARMGLASRHIRQGEASAALAFLQEAQALAETAQDRILLSRILNNTGIVHYGARDYDDALLFFRRSAEIRQQLGYRSGVVVNDHNIGDTLLRKGDLGRAWAAFQRSRDLARELGWTFGEQMNDAFIAFIEGQPPATDGGEAALARMEAATTQAAHLDDIELAVSARWLLGRLQAAHGQPTLARTTLHNAHALAQTLDARPLMRDIEDALADLPPVPAPPVG